LVNVNQFVSFNIFNLAICHHCHLFSQCHYCMYWCINDQPTFLLTLVFPVADLLYFNCCVWQFWLPNCGKLWWQNQCNFFMCQLKYSDLSPLSPHPTHP
jgi:hypothetical protein